MKRFLLTDYNISMNHNTELKIELPLRCHQLEASYERPGVLSVPVSAPKLIRTRRIKVNALLSKISGSAWSEEARVDDPTNLQPDGTAIYVAHLATKNAAHAIVHVLLNDQIVDKRAYDLWESSSPNPRMRALQTVGQASQNLDEILANPEAKGRNAGAFEVAVSNLFAASGFIVFNPGTKHAKAGEVVDVLAMHPLAPALFAIECTWKVANNEGKMAKLVQRSTDLGRALPGFFVKPVLVASKEECSGTEIAEAARYGVILLAAPHLRALKYKAEWNAGPSETAQWLSGVKRLDIPKSAGTT